MNSLTQYANETYQAYLNATIDLDEEEKLYELLKDLLTVAKEKSKDGNEKYNKAYKELCTTYFKGKVVTKPSADYFQNKNGKLLELVDDLQVLIGEVKSNEILARMINYVPLRQEINVYDRFLKPKTDKLIKKVENAGNLQQEEKEELISALRYIEDTIVNDPEKYTRARGNYAVDLDRVIFRKKGNELWSSLEGSPLQEYYSKADNGTVSFNSAKAITNSVINSFKNQPLVLSIEQKKAIKEIFNRMDKMDLEPKNDVQGEQGSKLYAFGKMNEIRASIIDILNKEDIFQTIRSSNQSLVKEENKLIYLKKIYENQFNEMKELFSFVEMSFGNSNTNLPGNVDNMREYRVHPYFKSNNQVNSNVNSLYLSYIFLKKNKISFDEYLANPIKSVNQLMENVLKEHSFEHTIKGKALGQALAEFYFAYEKQEVPFDSLFLSRSIEGMAYMSGSTDNVACASVIQATSEFVDYDVRLAMNYLGRNTQEENYLIIQNLLIMSEENFNYYQCNPYIEDEKTHTTEKKDNFSSLRYLKENDIDFKALSNKIKITLKDFLQAESVDRNSNPNYKLDPAMVIYGAIQTASLALAVKMPDASLDGVKELKEFIQSPKKVLTSIVDKTVKVPTIEKEKYSFDLELFDQKYKQASQNLVAFFKGEKNYNKQADKILKEMDKIGKQISKEASLKKVEALQIEQTKKLNLLKNLLKEENEKLGNALNNGVISGYYYKNRLDNVISLNHNNICDLFIADKKTYLKATKLEQLSDEEENGLYESAKIRAEVQKRQFLSQKALDLMNKEADIQKYIGELDFKVENVGRDKANYQEIDIAKLENKDRVSISVDEASNKIDKASVKNENLKNSKEKIIIK